MQKTVTLDFKGYCITTDKNLLKPADIHHWLSTKSYWSKQISFETVKLAFDHSFCIGVLIDDHQIGYARLITDYASFGYLADVYIDEPYRGQGLATKMIETLIQLDWVKGLRRILLATLDAHELYKPFGFKTPIFPERLMEITRPFIYGDTKNVAN